VSAGDKPGADLRDAVARRGSFVRTFKAVAWSFFGVRKSAEYEKDVAQLNPLHVIVAGVVAAALFVLGLVVLVKWVISSGVAAG
jgi:Protein of unknown function (DUF2970)